MSKLAEKVQSALDQIKQNANKLVATATEASQKGLDGAIAEATGNAKAAITALTADVGNSLGGPLESALKGISSCLHTPLGEFVARLLGQGAGAVTDAAKQLTAAMSAATKVITDKAGKVHDDLVQAIDVAKKGVYDVVDSVKGTVNTVRSTVERAISGSLVDTAKQFASGQFGNTIKDIAEAPGKVLAKVTEAGKAIAAALARGANDLKAVGVAAVAAGKTALGAIKAAASALVPSAASLHSLLEAARKHSADALGILKCIYNFAKHNLGIKALPDFALLEGGIKNMLEVGGKLFDAGTAAWEAVKDPAKREQAMKAMRAQLETVGKDLLTKGLAAAAEGIPKLISFVQDFKSDIRSALVLEGVQSVFDSDGTLNGKGDKPLIDAEGKERLPNAVIDGLFERVAGLVKDPITAVAEKMGMKPIVETVLGVVADPLKQGFRAALRTMALVRTAIKNVIEIVLPKLLEGGNSVLENVKKVAQALRAGLPPSVVDLVTTGLDKVLEIVTPLAAFLAETLGIKDTVTQVLDSIVGGFSDLENLKDLRAGMKEAVKGCDAAKVCAPGQKCEVPKDCDGAKVLSLHGDTVADETARRLGQAAKEAASKAQNEAATAQTALSAAEREVAKLMITPVLPLDDRGAAARAQRDRKVAEAQSKVDAARKTAEALAEVAEKAASRAAHLDPDSAQKKVIIAGWEKLSEAFMKLTWDVFEAIYKRFVDDCITGAKLYVGVYAGVIATALHVATYTVTYTPWIPTVAGWAINLFLSLYQGYIQLYFSLILPEYRMLIKDQLVSLRTQFVNLLQNESSRKTLERSMALAQDLAVDLAPIVERMRSVRDKMAMGSSALMTGPIGEVLKKLPPELVAVMTKAIAQGLKMLQKMGTDALSEGVKSLAKGGGSISVPKPADVAKMVVKIMKQPLIDFFVELLPKEAPWPPLAVAVKTFLETALRGVEDNPMQAVNPMELLKRIGDGLNNDGAQTAFVDFLVSAGAAAFAQMGDVSACVQANEDGTVAAGAAGAAGQGGSAMVVLKALLKTKIQAVAKLLTPTPDFSKVTTLLSGGAFGLLREVVHGTKGFLTCLLVKQVPEDPPALKGELRVAINRAFLTLESRGEFERVIGKGWKGVVARIVELVREPAITLLLKDVPEGKAKAAVRSALLGLSAENKAARLLELLSKGGLPGLLGEVLTADAVAEALAELLLGDLADATFNNAKLKAAVAAKLKQRGAELAASPGSLPPGFLKAGLGDLIALAAEPLEAWLGAQVSANVQHPALKSALLAVLKKGREDVMSGGSLATVLRGAGGLILGRLKTYFTKVREKLDAKAFAAVDAALRSLDETLKSVRAGAAAASSAMTNIALVLPGVIADLGQLDVALRAATSFQFPAEVLP